MIIGLLKHLVTRIYFPGAPGNGEDPLLTAVPAARRETLMAQPLAAKGSYQFDIALQDSPSGRPETVFLNV